MHPGDLSLAGVVQVRSVTCTMPLGPSFSTRLAQVVAAHLVRVQSPARLLPALVSAAEQLSVGCVNAGEAAAIAADGLRRERGAESGRRDVNKTVASASSSLQLDGSAA